MSVSMCLSLYLCWSLCAHLCVFVSVCLPAYLYPCIWVCACLGINVCPQLYFFNRKVLILGEVSMEWICDAIVFISYCFWKILTKPGLQINQVIFETLFNPNITCFHAVFFLVF
jgi:hypothetical protein